MEVIIDLAWNMHSIKFEFPVIQALALRTRVNAQEFIAAPSRDARDLLSIAL